ncbi:uncharacterized protein B0H18DRAFT_950740 [Fomitopsis serialis]|uniref:uncharacterized protein n=1 Tax=Fomitopsis serialis TaxID=139415 RepID=UPI0020075409|nr:uncharacterized protein B0H18DRAFT_950740 [Neoantrodia serialis]KAH9936470.1 hypothetical protein B0H18DRAFT_950740 [Neoantrodia serialis]
MAVCNAYGGFELYDIRARRLLRNFKASDAPPALPAIFVHDDLGLLTGGLNGRAYYSGSHRLIATGSVSKVIKFWQAPLPVRNTYAVEQPVEPQSDSATTSAKTVAPNRYKSRGTNTGPSSTVARAGTRRADQPSNQGAQKQAEQRRAGVHRATAAAAPELRCNPTLTMCLLIFASMWLFFTAGLTVYYQHDIVHLRAEVLAKEGELRSYVISMSATN